MEMSRRDVLRLSVAGGGGTALGGLIASGVNLAPLVAQAQELRIANAQVTPSVCPFCSVGCATLVHTIDGQIVNIEGDSRSRGGAPAAPGGGLRMTGWTGGRLRPAAGRLDMTFLSELLAPPLGMFNTRAARATFAVSAERRDDPQRFLWFGMEASNDTPLAWALADSTFDGMDRLLRPPESERLPFKTALAKLPKR